MAASSAGLSTAQLSARTGLPAGTLRMWESRHGFPTPVRLPGGHRRYGERDVEAVLEVQRLREQGLSLPAAIQRARREQPAGDSVFAGLHQRRPELSRAIATKPVLIAMSHAIEDEYLAHAGRGLVFGSFQREHYFRVAQARWNELARTAELAVVVADFREITEPRLAPTEVPVEVRHSMAREWSVIVAAPNAHACLAAWEQPGPPEVPSIDRRFEVIWSFEPETVRAAAEVAAELLSDLAPDVAGHWTQILGTAPSTDGMRFGVALAQRMVGYLGALAQRERAQRILADPAPDARSSSGSGGGDADATGSASTR